MQLQLSLQVIIKETGGKVKEKKYRVSADYLLREIAGEYAIIPVGADTIFLFLYRLNRSDQVGEAIGSIKTTSCKVSCLFGRTPFLPSNR